MKDVLARLMARVQYTPYGCWEWTGHLTRGYGRFYWNGRNGAAHRAAYELLVGPIPAGLQLDHLCRNKRCVHPDHVEPVTGQVNTQRDRVRITHCPSGHPYDEANTIWFEGQRSCRACGRQKSLAQRNKDPERWNQRTRDWRARRRAERPAPPPPALRTHCQRGHEFTPENTYHIQGKRRCRACHLVRAREYGQRKKKGRQTSPPPRGELPLRCSRCSGSPSGTRGSSRWKPPPGPPARPPASRCSGRSAPTP